MRSQTEKNHTHFYYIFNRKTLLTILILGSGNKKIIDCNFYNIYKSLSNNILTLRKNFEKKRLKIRLLKKMIVFLHSKFSHSFNRNKNTK